MELENFIKALLSGNICIQYSNINGKESLIINPRQDVKKDIEDYKAKISKIDDCLFSEVIDKIEDLDLSKMNSALDRETYTEEEAHDAYKVMEIMSGIIKETLLNKIEELKDLADEF